MKSGDRVKHVLSGQKMTIKKSFGLVSICILDIPVFYPENKFYKEHFNDIVVCQHINLIIIDNLNVSSNQLELF